MINYCSNISNEDIQYICNVIPPSDIRKYFTANSKSFSKIIPGFRANKIKDSVAAKMLYTYRKNEFVYSFIDKVIDIWLIQIKSAIKEKMEIEDNLNKAYLSVLIDSFFKDNVKLYFKLTNSDKSEEYIDFLNESIKLVDAERKNAFNNTTPNTNSKEKELKEEIKKANKEYTKTINKLTKDVHLLQKDIEVKAFQIANEKEKLELIKKEKDQLASENDKVKKALKTSQSEARKLVAEKKALEQKLNINQRYLTYNSNDMPKNIHPATVDDFEDFKESLYYNLKDLVYSTNKKFDRYSDYLTEFLSKILFLGTPIVVKKGCSENLIKCISNSAFGTQNYSILQYDENITSNNIVEFLKGSTNIVCLDNFIGNYNETILISICSYFKNKIIFLTFDYDRTINYLSDEFIEYVSYINLNRVQGMSSAAKLLGEATNINFEFNNISDDNVITMYTETFIAILEELKLSKSTIDKRSKNITGRNSLCANLLFDILPYCTDVLHINPFLHSKKLKNYINNSNRCPSGSLFEEWFENE